MTDHPDPAVGGDAAREATTRFIDQLGRLLSLGDEPGAAALLEREASDDPLRRALVALAIATSRGDGAAAVEAAGQALALAPEDPAVLQYAALAWRAAGDLAQAEAYARRAANRDPGTRSQLVLADVLARQGRFADAEASYRAVLEWEPGSAVALNGLGEMRARQGDNGGALALFVRATLADPEDELGLQHITQMYAQAGWAFGAMALARITRQSGHHPPEVQAVLDLLLVQLAARLAAEYPQSALPAELDGLVQRLSEESAALPPSFQVRVARELQDVGRTAAALAIAERLEDAALAPPERAHVLFLLGLAAENGGDPAGALESYEEALGADPGRWEAACNAANLLLEAGDAASLARIPEFLGRVRPDVAAAAPQLLYNEAIHARRTGDEATARERLERILRLTRGEGPLADVARSALAG